MIVATHPVTSTPSPIGVTRDGLVYELFYTVLPQAAFTPADVVDLYLHRGAFETVLADEDLEQDPDRWCSHTACGQEFILYLTYIASTISTLPLLVFILFVVLLLLGMMLPLFEPLMDQRPAIVPSVALSLALLCYAISLITGGTNDRQPLLDNLRYVLDTNTNSAMLISDTPYRDPWMAQIFPTADLKTATSVVCLPSPEYTVLNDHTTGAMCTVVLRLVPPPTVGLQQPLRQHLLLKGPNGQLSLAVEGHPLRLIHQQNRALLAHGFNTSSTARRGLRSPSCVE